MAYHARRLIVVPPMFQGHHYLDPSPACAVLHSPDGVLVAFLGIVPSIVPMLHGSMAPWLCTTMDLSHDQAPGQTVVPWTTCLPGRTVKP